MDRSKWEYKKLGDICVLLNGYAFKSEKYVDEGIRVMRITNVQKGAIVDDDPKFYPMSSQTEIQRYLLKENDLLVSLTGNVGRVGLLQRELLPAALNQRVACLRQKNNSLDLKYLFHLLNSDLFEKDCIANSQGIAQKNMSTKWLSDYELPIPPIADQQRIVAELDCLNEMIAVKQEQLKEFDKLAQSIFYDMFGNGYEKKLLGDFCEVGTGSTPSRKNEGLFYGGQIPWVKTTEVQNSDIYKTEETITDTAIEQTNCKLYPIGTILMAMYGQGKTRGQVARLMIKAATNQACAAIIPDDKVCDRDYLYEYLLLSYEKIRDMARGGNQANLNLQLVRSIPVPLPPLSLQQQFADKISAIEAQKELVKQSIAETQVLLDYTMDKYFG